ncbi:hypothetical protein ACERK3_19060 [Phycisphaerales bacterium AB-hyl4]|uniref:Uncharacterized protein n=1 Tax=Natronomicrosphaera hydrolytica TaxID=3242702 RepID=A0ABV4U9T7_9BACT
MKSVTMSVRVPEDDAAFIAGLDVPGAVTPSDKLRAIIAEARLRQEGSGDFRRALALSEQLLRPARQRLRDVEHRLQVHSDLVAAVEDWLPEALATAMTGPIHHDATGADDDDSQSLLDLEREFADRVFGLLEAVLRLGVTRQCRCYDPKTIARRLEPIMELARVIETMRDSDEK